MSLTFSHRAFRALGVVSQGPLLEKKPTNVSSASIQTDQALSGIGEKLLGHSTKVRTSTWTVDGPILNNQIWTQYFLHWNSPLITSLCDAPCILLPRNVAVAISVCSIVEYSPMRSFHIHEFACHVFFDLVYCFCPSGHQTSGWGFAPKTRGH